MTQELDLIAKVYKAAAQLPLSVKLIIYKHIAHIRIIEKSEDFLQTFAIDYKGTLYMSRAFYDNFLSETHESFFLQLILHELLHQVGRDTLLMKKDKTELERLALNIAMDMRINAFVHNYTTYITEQGKNCFPEIDVTSYIEDNYHEFCQKRNWSYTVSGITTTNAFNYLYLKQLVNPERKDFSAEEEYIYYLLQDYRFMRKVVPDYYTETVSKFSSEKRKDIARQLHLIHVNIYENPNRFYGFERIYTLVKELLDSMQEDGIGLVCEDILLMGNHRAPGLSDDQREARQKEIERQLNIGIDEAAGEQVAKDLSSNMSAGNGGTPLQHSFLEDSDTAVLDLSSFTDLIFYSELNNILGNSDHRFRTRKVPFISSTIAKRDIIDLASNYVPPLWRKKVQVRNVVKNTLPIYIDVSGSMHSYIPRILNLIIRMEHELDYVWVFSTFVHKTPQSDLKSRSYKTSGGTDFMCIYDHAVKQEYTDIIVITDGYDCCNDVDPRKTLTNVITILVEDTGDSCRDNMFCKAYPESVYMLETLIK